MDLLIAFLVSFNLWSLIFCKLCDKLLFPLVLVQYGIFLFCFSYFYILFHSPKGLKKYEKFEKHLPNCTRYRAITSTYIIFYIINTMKKHIMFPIPWPPSPLFRAKPVYTNKFLWKIISFFSYNKEVLYLRWNERHLRAYFERLMTVLQKTLLLKYGFLIV